jgi:hypothetical protein
MKHSAESAEGQQKVTIDTVTLANIALLCGEAVTLGAWRDRFAPSLRQVDRAAAVKAHDLISESVISARQIARALSIQLPDVAGLCWELSTPPAERPVEF